MRLGSFFHHRLPTNSALSQALKFSTGNTDLKIKKCSFNCYGFFTCPVYVQYSDEMLDFIFFV